MCQHRRTGKHISQAANVSPVAVSRALKRAGLSRLKDLDPAEPIHRYERENPSEIIHLKIKNLGRFEEPGHHVKRVHAGLLNPRAGKQVGGAGREYVNIAIDDHSRLSFCQIHPDEKADSAIAYLKATAAYYQSRGFKMTGIMTDSGPCYTSRPFAKPAKISG